MQGIVRYPSGPERPGFSRNGMMNASEREVALGKMEAAVKRFYHDAIQIGNHPFIEFCGVMTAYVNSCRIAHEKGIDFSECNVHSGTELPMMGFEVAYLNEKLGCIFGGRIQALRPHPVD